MKEGKTASPGDRTNRNNPNLEAQTPAQNQTQNISTETVSSIMNPDARV